MTVEPLVEMEPVENRLHFFSGKSAARPVQCAGIDGFLGIPAQNYAVEKL